MSDQKPSLFPSTWTPSSLSDIFNKPYQPPPWILEDLLPAQSGLLCSGLPHAGKSLNWLAGAIESVVLQKIWGQFKAPKVKRALFIETEDPRWLVEDRVRGIATGLGLDARDSLENYGFGLACTGPFDLVQQQTQLEKLVESWTPDWCVLSTLQGLLQGRDWKEQKDMGAVNAALVRLQRKIPLVVITHSPRDGQRRAAGSITQDANYLTLMHFDKQHQDGETLMHVTGDSKMGSELEFDLRLKTVRVMDDDGRERTQVRRIIYEADPLTKKDRILQTIAQHPGADIKALALICECSERYIREVAFSKKANN